MATKIPGFPHPDELSLVDEHGDEAVGQGPAVFGERESSGEYRGPERRRYHRRKENDRRDEVRFEAGKSDRRSGLDRRKGGWKTNSTV